MKILFTTDLHGYKWKYERIFEIATASQAKVVVNSGDMLPLAEPPEQRKFISTYHYCPVKIESIVWPLPL